MMFTKRGYTKTMKWGLALGVLTAGIVWASTPYALAVEIVPANAHDIVKALGPDATGLALSQESLPDLFTLTANRIEEDAKQFTIQEPYTAGRWKGGKVIIEYARDLSYTLVSVYDKNGHRQRLYSVSTKFTEHVEQLKAQTQEPRRSTSEASSPEESASPRPVESQSASRSRPSRRMTATSAKEGEPKSSYEWDETKSAYVQVPASNGEVDLEEVPEQKSATKTPEAAAEAPVPAEKNVTPSASRKRRSHHKDIEVAEASSKSAAADDGDGEVWIPPKASQTPRVKVQVANTTWVERRPEESEETPPAHPHRKKKHPKKAPEPSAPETPADNTAVPVVATSKTSPDVERTPVPQTSHDHWVPAEVQDRPSSEAKASGPKTSAVDDSVPSEEELLGINPPSSKKSAEPTRKSSSRSDTAVVQAARTKSTSSSYAASKSNDIPDLTEVPAAKSDTNDVPAPSHVKAAPAATQTPYQSPAPEPVLTALPSQGTPASNPTPVPSTEELLASSSKKSGPDTSAGDAWVPKETPKPKVVDAVIPDQEPVKVAMVPKSVPVDNSVDNLLNIAKKTGAGAPHDSDAWVPQKTQSAKADVDIDQQVARLRAQENKKAAPHPVVKVRQDVNNPEEGVLPVSSFEKFSGPMYGRHREYERRFVPGKLKRSKVPVHDFYVDEIDRKKEIHNVYFYIHQKGKAPRLVAVERHDKVAFLGNYDIDKEDKGKITTY